MSQAGHLTLTATYFMLARTLTSTWSVASRRTQPSLATLKVGRSRSTFALRTAGRSAYRLLPRNWSPDGRR